MTNKEFREFCAEVREALEPVGKKWGMKITTAHGTESDTGLSLKLNCAYLEDGVDNSAEKEWKANCFYFGLKADAFGKEVVLSNRKYKIVGINARAPRYPVIVTDVVTKKTYRYCADEVRKALGEEYATGWTLLPDSEQ